VAAAERHNGSACALDGRHVASVFAPKVPEYGYTYRAQDGENLRGKYILSYCRNPGSRGSGSGLEQLHGLHRLLSAVTVTSVRRVISVG
jgi:hypothetical protein